MEGIIYAQFVDLRDAHDAYAMLKEKSNWIVQYISPKLFTVQYEPENLASTSDHEGQITVKVLYIGQYRDCDAAHTAFLVKDLLDAYGGLASFDVSALEFPLFTFRAEFYDVTAAENAVKFFNGFKVAVSYTALGFLSAADVVSLFRLL